MSAAGAVFTSLASGARPTFVSLFAGVGGMDIAFEAAGWQCVGQVEIDDFCNRILSLRWPDVYRVRDVRTCTGRTGKGWRRYHRLPRVDALIGGFPCQDISAAGKGAGIRAGARSGLWFEFARLIGELRPRLVLLENVPAITTRDGDVVIETLAAMGYDARWGTIRASDAGAAHQRERWFCVAHANHAGLARWQVKRRDNGAQQSPAERDSNGGREAKTYRVGVGDQRGIPTADELAYPPSARWGTWIRLQDGREKIPWGNTPIWWENRVKFEARARAFARYSEEWLEGSTQSRLGGDADGLSAWMDRSYDSLHVARPGQPQHDWEPARITSRRDFRASRLKALGNAVVPQVIYPIACAMREWLEVTA